MIIEAIALLYWLRTFGSIQECQMCLNYHLGKWSLEGGET